MPNVNSELLDSQVRHQIYLERYSSQVAKDMLSILIKSERSAREIFDQRLSRILELGFDSGPATSKRTAALISDLGAAIEQLRQQEAFSEFATALNAELEDFADYEAGFIVRTNNDILSDALDGTPFAISFESVAPAQVFAAATAKPFNISPGTMAKTIGDYIAGMAASERRRIEDAVTTGVVNGETTRNIVRSVWGTVQNRENQDGNAAVIKTRRGAEALVKTAIKHVSTVAQDETYKQNTDLMKGLEWVSTLDSRVTAICLSRDGNIYPVDSGPRPPAHMNCRSVMAPVLKTYRELGINVEEPEQSTRAYLAIPAKMNVTQYRAKLRREGLTKDQQNKIINSLSGQTDSKDFTDFFARQSKEFQETVIGVKRAELYRKGDLKLSDMIRNGQYINLDELRKLHPTAFNKIE